MLFNPYGLSATRNPFRDLERLVEDLSAGFQRVLPSVPRNGDIPLNVWANDQGLVITAEIPGVDPSSVTVDVLGDTLTIAGKRTAAATRLGNIRNDAKDFLAVELDASVALGEVEIASGEAAQGRARLESVERQARSKGFLLIANQAAAARR